MHLCGDDLGVNHRRAGNRVGKDHSFSAVRPAAQPVRDVREVRPSFLTAPGRWDRAGP